jgi:hypothetical protein
MPVQKSEQAIKRKRTPKIMQGKMGIFFPQVKSPGNDAPRSLFM